MYSFIYLLLASFSTEVTESFLNFPEDFLYPSSLSLSSDRGHNSKSILELIFKKLRSVERKKMKLHFKFKMYILLLFFTISLSKTFGSDPVHYQPEQIHLSYGTSNKLNLFFCNC